MTAVEVACPDCGGGGWIFPPGTWELCAACAGIGRAWAPGAPSYGCVITLAERQRGEVVTLGNGDQGRILWHSKAGRPTTYLGLIGEFDGVETHNPVRYPSCIGVESISAYKLAGDTNSHAGDRSPDFNDPMQRDIFYSTSKGSLTCPENPPLPPPSHLPPPAAK